jgi:hypothetical protein
MTMQSKFALSRAASASSPVPTAVAFAAIGSRSWMMCSLCTVSSSMTSTLVSARSIRLRSNTAMARAGVRSPSWALGSTRIGDPEPGSEEPLDDASFEVPDHATTGLAIGR